MNLGRTSDATYNLIADYAQATSRFFPESSRPLILLLRKAIFIGHTNHHRTTHFKASGTIVHAVSGPLLPSAI